MDDDYVDLESSDWGDSIDDADGESYESFAYEPLESTYDPEDDYDYDHSERINCKNANPDHCGECDPSYHDNFNDEEDGASKLRRQRKRDLEKKRIIENDNTTDRKKAALRWLYNSRFSKKFKTDDGFFVNSGPIVKLTNGHSIDITKWLVLEGIGHNRYVSGYIIKHLEESDQFAERVMFFKVNTKECIKADEYQIFVEKHGECTNFNPEVEGILFSGNYNRRKSEIDESTDRQKKILDWIHNSSHSQDFRKGKGFYIRKGTIVKLENGERIDFLDWLLREGFGSNKRVSNYNVKHSEQSSNFPEMLHFFELPKDKN